ncbi:hypothetical protein O6H91_23G050600 [Diphasiastrum complanatum]|uniref:Uncharacterized protein n=1 Tax=Diphasiastrum complanatum TaxID=34168 RepID=A0ACC2AAI9_DIPCM|nr:hypothetical protein O6H91_23G050600 [Diphasiastrum complanatum]
MDMDRDLEAHTPSHAHHTRAKRIERMAACCSEPGEKRARERERERERQCRRPDAADAGPNADAAGSTEQHELGLRIPEVGRGFERWQNEAGLPSSLKGNPSLTCPNFFHHDLLNFNLPFT